MLFLDYDDRALHDPRSASEQCVSAKATVEVNSPGTLTFRVAEGHPLAGSFADMSAEREFVLRDGDVELFRGRLFSGTREMISPSRTLTCIGDLDYLNDARLRPYATYEGEGTEGHLLAPRAAGRLLEWYIGQSNSRLDLSKQFAIGRNEGGSYGEVTRSSTQRPTVGAEISDKLIDPLGGYLFVRHDGGRRVIEWLADGQGECSQTIEFGRNLLDYNVEWDASDLVTAIIPTGRDGDGDEFGVDGMPDGPVGDCHKQGDRLVFAEGVSRYGVIEDARSYDVTTMDGLAAACAADLERSCAIVSSVELTAADMSIIDPSVMPFRLGQWIRVIARPLGIDERMLCVRIDYDIVNPLNTKYTLGATRRDVFRAQARQGRSTGNRISEIARSTTAIDAVAKAAAGLAQAAQESADAKARTIYASDWPDPPYRQGDVLVLTTEDGTEEYRANTTREA